MECRKRIHSFRGAVVHLNDESHGVALVCDCAGATVYGDNSHAWRGVGLAENWNGRDGLAALRISRKHGDSGSGANGRFPIGWRDAGGN